MRSISKFWLATFGSIVLTITPAHAGNLLGFYAGGAVSQTNIRDDSTGVSNSSTGWAARVGIKPIPLIGVEAEYADFGKTKTQISGFSSADFSLSVKSTAAFALLYIPNPVPKLDLIIKGGYSNTQRTQDGTWTTINPGVGTCPINNPNCATRTFTGSVSQTKSNFAYGAGIQVTILKLAFRAEYERIHDTLGDPDMATLGVAVKF